MTMFYSISKAIVSLLPSPCRAIALSAARRLDTSDLEMELLLLRLLLLFLAAKFCRLKSRTCRLCSRFCTKLSTKSVQNFFRLALKLICAPQNCCGVNCVASYGFAAGGRFCGFLFNLKVGRFFVCYLLEMPLVVHNSVKFCFRH